VEGVSFTAAAGQVTGFVGANGAGKTTTLRMLGLVAPTGGTSLIQGRGYLALAAPRSVAGAVLDGAGAHPSHRGRAHLRILAASAGVDGDRVAEVLELVELTEHADREVGGYSLGMRRRLALAGALPADPPVLILDEPTNGLDPAGIRWIRGFLRGLATQGRCVLVSSHQLGELQALADHIVMIHQGRIVADAPLPELLDGRASLEDVFFDLVGGK
jgi:ABC-2 type transport system ATP-binding protein